MSSLALYDHHYPLESPSNLRRQITIVLHEGFEDIEIISRVLAKHLRTSPAPARVLIFGFEWHTKFIQTVLDVDSPFRNRLNVAWGLAQSTHVCFGIIRNGANNSFQSIGIDLTQEQVAEEIRIAASMTAQSIFADAKCMQVAPRGIHYSKTSKSHSASFIRASNALIKSKNVLTLAYWLQQFISRSARRILVDTSAISSVIYAACYTAIQSGSRNEMPIIDSFQSYEGLSEEDLKDAENTLFVISASTSGNLAREAFGKGIKKDRLLTLFLLAEKQSDQEALCDLRKDKLNPDGLNLIQSWNAKLCDLCKRGSAPIQIGGDLFLTALPETEAVVLLKSHLPANQRNVISKFSGLGVFRTHRRIGDKTSEMSIDTRPLFNVEESSKPTVAEFQEEWQRILRRYVPANVTHFTYPDYPSNDDFAPSVVAFAAQYIKTSYEVARGDELVNCCKVAAGCGIIITSCVDDPIEMMGINRDLRTVIPGGTATYLLPFLRAKSENDAKVIGTNLTYGDRGLNTYSLYKMYDLLLPDDRERDPWEIELKYIVSLIDWLEEQEETVPNSIAERRTQLRNATDEGMIDNLFWPDSTGKGLQIRSNFVLLPTNDGTHQLNQADIYFVLSSLLNNLRQIETGDSLRVSQYQRKVICPSNFVRFNDGVIQAAILRATCDNELNYIATDSKKYSEEMTHIIVSMIDKADAEQGEALTEFFLALALGHLRLEEDDLDLVIKTALHASMKISDAALCIVRGIQAGIRN